MKHTDAISSEPAVRRGAWGHYNPVRVHFGVGEFDRLTEHASGRRILLVTTPGFTRRGLTARVQAELGTRLAGVCDWVCPNPCLHELAVHGRELQGFGYDSVLAIGGGSTLDTAKFLRVVLANGKDPAEFTAMLLAYEPLGLPPVLPMVAVPTTSGSGSEATPFATLWDSRTCRKYSFSSPVLFPNDAVLDPRLTYDLPRHLTISCGLDALSQALESIWNRNWDPASAALAASAARQVLTHLPTLLEDPRSPTARASLMEASLFAGMAISQTRTALAHSMSYPITARLGLPHGLACSFMLPALLEFNAQADMGEIAGLVANLGDPDWQALQTRIINLLRRCEVAGYLSNHGVTAASTFHLIHEMFTPGRVENNLRRPTADDVHQLLVTSFEALARTA